MKLFLAAFTGDPISLAAGLDRFKALLGEPDVASEPLAVTETAYYEAEMGPALIKVYLSWPKLIEPEELVDWKLRAMEWERELASEGRRSVNLDPGYISDGGLVLSTAKYNGHRLFLGRGIWGELTLHYHRGAFEAFPWTYKDYKRPEVQALLELMRRRYMEQRKPEQASHR